MPAPAITIAKVRSIQPSRPPRGGQGYITRSQWRHIDLNGALFAQSGGGKATLFRTERYVRADRALRPRSERTGIMPRRAERIAAEVVPLRSCPSPGSNLVERTERT